MKSTLNRIASMTAATFFILASSFGVCAEENKENDMVNATLVKPATNQAQTNQSQTKKKTEADSVKLESVFVGDKEQPAISYFIPWQGIGTPDKLHWNVEQKHDGALDLVDRDIMLRSMHIYDEMNLEAPQQAD